MTAIPGICILALLAQGESASLTPRTVRDIQAGLAGMPGLSDTTKEQCMAAVTEIVGVQEIPRWKSDRAHADLTAAIAAGLPPFGWLKLEGQVSQEEFLAGWRRGLANFVAFPEEEPARKAAHDAWAQALRDMVSRIVGEELREHDAGTIGRVRAQALRGLADIDALHWNTFGSDMSTFPTDCPLPGESEERAMRSNLALLRTPLAPGMEEHRAPLERMAQVSLRQTVLTLYSTQRDELASVPPVGFEPIQAPNAARPPPPDPDAPPPPAPPTLSPPGSPNSLRMRREERLRELIRGTPLELAGRSVRVPRGFVAG